MADRVDLPLYDVVEKLIDYRGKSPKKSAIGIPVISAKVVKSGRILENIEQTIAPEYYDEWMRRGLPEIGDVVMTTEGPMGEVAQLDVRTSRYALGQRIVTLRGKPGILHNGYLKFLLMSPEVQARLEARATGTTVLGISQKQLRDLPLPIVGYSEQEAIAALLGALDDKIELNRQMSATLEEMARALYRSWFVDFDPVHARALGQSPAHMDATTAYLFPDSFSPDGLPKGWDMSNIGEVAEIVGGATPKTKEPSFWDGPHRWATPRDLSKLGQPVLFETDRTLTDAGLAKVSSGLSPAGTVLLSSRAPIGYVAIAQNPVAVNQGFIALRETDRISSVEAYFWVQSNMDAILANANGSTFQEISKKNFRPLPCVVAPDSVRIRFRDLAGTWFDRVAGLCAESANLAELRDALLPRLMSGELRIRDAEKQVEEVV